MKQKLQTYLQKFKHHKKGLDARLRRDIVWHDWYRMLGLGALTLIVLFGVGAYTFLVTIQRTHSEEGVDEIYHPPTSREEMLETATFLQQRTDTFAKLRLTPPIIPDPGIVDETEFEEPAEDIVNEEAPVEQVEE